MTDREAEVTGWKLGRWDVGFFGGHDSCSKAKLNITLIFKVNLVEEKKKTLQTSKETAAV